MIPSLRYIINAMDASAMGPFESEGPNDCVMKLACPLIPRDCQLEIIQMLISTRLPQFLIQGQSMEEFTTV